jgi:hypothetical protein
MTTLLTAEELRGLKKLCSDPFMELGLMTRPEHMKCFEAKVVTHSVTVDITFPTVDDAESWNLMYEKQIRLYGHMATVALTVLVALVARDISKSIAVGSIAAIAKDEIQAKVWYPKVHEKWSLIRIYTFNYQQFPQQLLRVEWIDIIRDKDGKEQDRRKHDIAQYNIGGPNGLPEEFVRDIVSRAPQYKKIQYKAGAHKI